jgi:hypothetical protein
MINHNDAGVCLDHQINLTSAKRGAAADQDIRPDQSVVRRRGASRVSPIRACERSTQNGAFCCQQASPNERVPSNALKVKEASGPFLCGERALRCSQATAADRYSDFDFPRIPGVNQNAAIVLRDCCSKIIRYKLNALLRSVFA